ncbi:MAG: hypothetical protein ACREJM_06735, partial [Candidatus Saccharimonadales bacterium]
GAEAAVLSLAVDDDNYHRLKFKRLTIQQVQRLNARLKGRARNTYATRHDAMIGPLVYQPKVMQQKSQTANAQNLLNGPFTRRSVQ